MDDQLLREARANLDEYYAGLPPEKSGEESVKRLCWHIERHHNEERRALEMAVGTWLWEGDLVKASRALGVISNLKLQQHKDGLEKLRDEIGRGTTSIPKYWLSRITRILDTLGH
jgi:hypothetical protein